MIDAMLAMGKVYSEIKETLGKIIKFKVINDK